jgi:hypothetical protein
MLARKETMSFLFAIRPKGGAGKRRKLESDLLCESDDVLSFFACWVSFEQNGK